MDVNYLAYADAVGKRNENAAGLNSLSDTLDKDRLFKIQEGAQQRQNSLADIQMRQGNMAVDQGQAEQAALMQATGTTSLADAYGKQMGSAAQDKAQAQKAADYILKTEHAQAEEAA